MIYLLIPLLIVIGIIVYIRYKNRYISQTPWNHFFDGFEFSVMEFYANVEAEMRKRNIPSVAYGKEAFLQTHIASSRREYLKITRSEFVFYICASPFSTGTFVSEWLCIKREHLLDRIPLLSKLLGRKRGDKTFYQMDTEAMYRSAIHASVMAVLDGLTEAKGIRALTEFERQLKDIR